MGRTLSIGIHPTESGQFADIFYLGYSILMWKAFDKSCFRSPKRRCLICQTMHMSCHAPYKCRWQEMIVNFVWSLS